MNEKELYLQAAQEALLKMQQSKDCARQRNELDWLTAEILARQAEWRRAPKVALDDFIGHVFIADDCVEDDHDAIREAAVQADVAWFWAAEPIEWRLSADDVLDQGLDQMSEGAGSQIGVGAKDELQALLDSWCSDHPVLAYERGIGIVLVAPACETCGAKLPCVRHG